MADVVEAVLIGLVLILVTPSVIRQRTRLWGPGQAARNELARKLANDPGKLTAWALKEGMIILWASLLGVFLMVFPTLTFLIDHIRGVPPEHYAYIVFMLLFMLGTFFAYAAVRSTAQLTSALESIEPSEDDAGDPLPS